MTLEEWENRIDPALFELQKSGGLRRWEGSCGSRTVRFLGSDARWPALLDERGQSGAISGRPDLALYAFRDLNDLAILRRFKEYPDETPRSELVAPWAGECGEENALLLVNLDWGPNL